MNPFIAAALGGILIGTSAVMLMALSGRIAGISGIVGGLLPPRPASDRSWRLAFIAGLIAAPLLLRAATGDDRIGAPTVGLGVLMVAGLLVGIGTALGGGCTSGHGTCGISRLSPFIVPRSMGSAVAATLTIDSTESGTRVRLSIPARMAYSGDQPGGWSFHGVGHGSTISAACGSPVRADWFAPTIADGMSILRRRAS